MEKQTQNCSTNWYKRPLTLSSSELWGKYSLSVVFKFVGWDLDCNFFIPKFPSKQEFLPLLSIWQVQFNTLKNIFTICKQRRWCPTYMMQMIGIEQFSVLNCPVKRVMLLNACNLMSSINWFLSMLRSIYLVPWIYEIRKTS